MIICPYMHPALVGADGGGDVVRRADFGRRRLLEVARMLAITIHCRWIPLFPSRGGRWRTRLTKALSIFVQAGAAQRACPGVTPLIVGRVSLKSQAALAQLVEHIIR